MQKGTTYRITSYNVCYTKLLRFDGNFDNSDKQIAVAPLPGKRAVYGAYWLYNLARENHIDWRPLSNNVFMNVNRSGKTFGAHEFEMALSDALINNGAGDKLDVVSNIGQTTMVAPSDASTEIKVKNLSFNQRNQSYSAIVDLYVNGESYAKTSVSGRFFAKVEVPIISSNRITSYNVCYTKLLRRAIHEQALMLHME